MNTKVDKLSSESRNKLLKFYAILVKKKLHFIHNFLRQRIIFFKYGFEYFKSSSFLLISNFLDLQGQILRWFYYQKRQYT